MKHFIIFTDDDKRQKVRVRSKFFMYPKLPPSKNLCVWCGKHQVKPVVDICQYGFIYNHYQTLCVCPGCGRGTCLNYYMPHELGTEIETPVPVTRG